MHALNHCNLPPWVLASREFQERPQALELGDVRHSDKRLFDHLDRIADPEARGAWFHDYVSVKFRLHEWPDHAGAARASLRHSYVHFLVFWTADSNQRSGAVLKSWVESRFGLRATYHGGRLEADPAARERYLNDRMAGAARTVGAWMQLDLLYTFCQYELTRRHPGQTHLTLYRGTHDPEEYQVEATPGSPTQLVRLNNLSSFTSESELAWEFGSSVWEVRVPLAKICCFSGLLPRHILQGENEYLVLGGEYAVRSL